jgi:hypothetical protein
VCVDQETAPGDNGTTRAAPPNTRQQAPGSPPRAPRPLLGGLTSDPRLPIWVLRLTLAAVAAIGFTVWLGWRFGATAAAVIIIADIIYRSRTTSVIPAAVRVTFAQRRTQRRLKGLRSAGYLSLHLRAIPGSQSAIDHLVVGPGGVFAIDSEFWDKRLPIRSVRHVLYHGPYSQKKRLAHARWEAAQASALLTEDLGRDIRARPAMVIYGPTVPWHFATLDGVDVFSGGRVRKYFSRQTKMNRATRLDADEIKEIHDAAAHTLPSAHSRGLN